MFDSQMLKTIYNSRLQAITRRHFLRTSGVGLGAIALASLLNDELQAGSASAATARQPHFRPTAKSVIYLNMTGAPSQVDLFDHKPKLVEFDNKPIPQEFVEGQRFAFISGPMKALASPYKFRQHGQSGMWISDQLPHLTKIVDRVSFIRSMHTDEINHVPAQLLLNTGSPRMGRPSIGSWVTYGLGSEAQDLPGFVVLASGKAGRCGSTCWGSGFLPSTYQGVQFRSEGDSVLYLSNPAGVDGPLRRKTLDTIEQLNRKLLEDIGDPEIETRIHSFEMAYRMQTSVPELMDIGREPESVHRLYGTQQGKTSFSNNCLLARRLVERGVRFVQLDHGGWDHHGGTGDQNLVTNLPQRCRETDQGAAALIVDLASRGLLDDTLVLWGGEFGRTPMLQGEKTPQVLGRDHQRTAYTIWMAGGGIKAGTVLGATDELGCKVVEDPVHVHDLQATVLHTLGLDHTKLTYKFQGRQFRLTDVFGTVVKKLLA